MKVNTNELSGPALDYAVAIAQGATNFRFDTVATYWVVLDGEDRAISSGWSEKQNWNPSTNWGLGGPIIEREGIGLDYYPDGGHPQGGEWGALTNEGTVESFGPTPLIAAMRCFCRSKLGNEIEIPAGLGQPR